MLSVSCSHKPFREADVKASEGIVYGKVETVFHNGVDKKEPICNMTYGESVLESAEGGAFTKTVVLEPGGFFIFARETGPHKTRRITCYLGTVVSADFILPYDVTPGALNYLGRFTVRVDLENSVSNFVKAVLSPVRVALDGQIEIERANEEAADSVEFLRRRPELRKYLKVPQSRPTRFTSNEKRSSS